jgi:elongation factor Ts
MTNFSAKDVQSLRQETGAGIMDAKKALLETNGDMAQAKRWLREHGLASMSKRESRENSQGAVGVSRKGNLAAIVSLKCETDFVAKSEPFLNVLDELVVTVLEKGADSVDEFKEELENLKITSKENVELGQVIRFEASPGSVLGDYKHVQSNRGVNAVLVELDGGDEALAHDIAVHIAFAKPAYITRNQVPDSRVQEEKSVIRAMLEKEGKPSNQIDKILEGRINDWFKEQCLIEQPYVKDEKKTIKDLLGNIEIIRFAQVLAGT